VLAVGCGITISPPPAEDPHGQPTATFWDTTSIDFAKDSAVMDAAARKAADALVADLKKSTVRGITVKGRSDQDEPGKAKALVKARSKLVIDYLVSQGVARALFDVNVPNPADELLATVDDMHKQMGPAYQAAFPAATAPPAPGVDVVVATQVTRTPITAPPPPFP